MLTDVVQHIQTANTIVVLDPNGRTANVHTLDNVADIASFLPHHDSGFKTTEKDIETDFQGPTPSRANYTTLKPSQDEAEDLSRRTGDISVYSYYYRCIGLWRTVLTVSILVIFTFASNYPRFWIKWYSENPSTRYPQFVGVYIVLAFVASFSQGAMIWYRALRSDTSVSLS